MAWIPDHSTAVLGYTNSIAPLKTPAMHSRPSEATSVPWLIVGGGIHGVHIAARLIATGTANPAGVCLVDDGRHLLQKWKCRTAATGMEYLRSSAGFHLDVDDDALISQFGNGYRSPGHGKKMKRKKKARGEESQRPAFSNDYARPRLDVFNRHCDSVVAKYDLEKLHTRGLVTAIDPNDAHVGVKVTLPDDTVVVYEAGHVVLALGNDEPAYAEWVDEKDIENGLVEHLLDIKEEERHSGKRYDGTQRCRAARHSFAVIGGGITAAHKALELVRNARSTGDSSSSIHLIARSPLKEQQFDTDQSWMMTRSMVQRSKEGGGAGMTKKQRMFSQCSCWKERRKIIAKERVPGTVTAAVNRGKDGLRYHIENGDIQWHQAEVVDKRYVQHDSMHHCQIELFLSHGETVLVDRVLLATGFQKRLPGGTLIQTDLVEKAGLRVSDCGYPIVDENLSWHPRISVAGALAELELGPSARNIAGARLAAERIVPLADDNKRT